MTPRLERLIHSTRLARRGARSGSVPSELRPSGWERIEGLTRLVEQALRRALPGSTRAPRVMNAAMRYCVFSGGKRFRPLLCLGACEAVGAPARQALPAACAVEFVHTYSLVHDDLPAMDNADRRRGRPTCHRKFGEGNAILVGDALLTRAFEFLSQNGTLNAVAVIRTLGEACGTLGLIGGQALDLRAISRPQMVTERMLREIARRKTAALITASVTAGAMAADASPGQTQRLRRYGRDLGLAFQFIDDIHDWDGLARMLGPDEARVEAQRLIRRAVDALRPFGRRAETLRHLAMWLADTASRHLR